MNHESTARRWATITLAWVIGLVVGGAAVYATTCNAAPKSPIVVSTPQPTPTPTPTATPAPIRIYVSGAVRSPDVYQLAPGSIVRDVIELAGGPSADADLARLNLAVELRDQQQVHVPRAGEAGVPLSDGPHGTGGGESGGLININTATPAELESLPRVGPSTAQKIVDYRQDNGPFETIEEIQAVSGIGEATFAGMADRITVGP